MPDRPCLSFTQIQAAMQAMIEQALQLPEEPVAMAIVDATGNLLAYNTMDNLRLYRMPRAPQGLYGSHPGYGYRGSRPAAAQPGAQHQ